MSVHVSRCDSHTAESPAYRTTRSVSVAAVRTAVSRGCVPYAYPYGSMPTRSRCGRRVGATHRSFPQSATPADFTLEEDYEETDS